MIAVLGAGAFGTALAQVMARKTKVVLWGRETSGRGTIAGAKTTSDLAAIAPAQTVLIALPAQVLSSFVIQHKHRLAGKRLIACCKGIDLQTLKGPTTVLVDVPGATPAILTGPSFAADIQVGLPTALTLACADQRVGEDIQGQLSTSTLRLYSTTDVIGAELGGAIKNVIAIGCGVAMGAGFGQSARAALMTRGFAEMTRIGAHFGARYETLAGLSGFGDLALTCTSDQSRNYRYGLHLAGISQGEIGTVEGVATAKALVQIAENSNLDLPISKAVHDLIEGRLTPEQALLNLLNRPLKEE